MGQSSRRLWYTFARTYQAAANRTNVYVIGKNNIILPIPMTMQGISTSPESKEEKRKKIN